MLMLFLALPVLANNVTHNTQLLRDRIEGSGVRQEIDLAFELLPLLQQQKYNKLKQVWENVPFCGKIQGTLYEASKTPKYCKKDDDGFPSEWYVNVRVQRNTTIDHDHVKVLAVEGYGVWMNIVEADYLSRFDQPVWQYNSQLYRDYLKKYEDIGVYAELKNAMFIFVVRGSGFRAFMAADTELPRWEAVGRLFYNWVDWVNGQNLTVGQSINEGFYPVGFDDYMLLRQRLDPQLAQGVSRMFGAFYAEAMKQNHPKHFHEFKQTVYYFAITTGDDKAKLSAFEQESLWKVLAIQMPADKKQKMQEHIAQNILGICEAAFENSKMKEMSQCRNFRTYAQKYGLWSKQAEDRWKLSKEPVVEIIKRNLIFAPTHFTNQLQFH